MHIVCTVIFSFIITLSFAQNGEVVKGNKYFKDGNYDKAEESYKKALAKKPNNTTATYNLGNTLYKKEKTEDAIKSFDETVANTSEAELKSKALYNKGVLHHKNKQLPEAIEAYKQALRLTPNDAEVRKNLQLALMQQKQQQPQDQKKQKQKQEQKPKEQQQEKKQEQQPKPQQSKITRKQAEQYLKAMEQREKELQEKMQKKVGVPSQPEKDW
jgi:Ca-activated chloride channel homolog